MGELRLLANTEAIIRFAVDELPAKARTVLSDPDNEIFVSTASIWEIATKVRIGKLSLPDAILSRGVARWIVEDGFAILPVRGDHAEGAGFPDIDHRDPWNRMILAQARIEGLTIVGSDKIFAANGATVIWR